MGDDVRSGQLHLDFRAYDFSQIPIETLSTIYEQFLAIEGRSRQEGAYYTPIPLVDFMLAELDSHHPLRKGMRVRLVIGIYVEPEARLDSLLASHFPEVDVDALDPMFSSAALAHLVHLVINAILYATSAGVEPQPRWPSGKKARGATKGLPDRLPVSGDEVYYLPGKIDITSVRNIQALERAPRGGELMHRFMVRGHWRRAAPTWQDQRPRWIKPYWKGPDMATLIERAYRLKA